MDLGGQNIVVSSKIVNFILIVNRHYIIYEIMCRKKRVFLTHLLGVLGHLQTPYLRVYKPHLNFEICGDVFFIIPL